MNYEMVVVSKNGSKEALDEALEPFANYGEDSAHMNAWDYLEFYSVTDDYRDEYDKGKMEAVVMEGGVFLPREDQMFKVVMPEGRSFAEIDYDVNKLRDDQWIRYVIPSSLNIVDIPIRRFYPDINDYVRRLSHHGYEEDFDAIGYWENPNARWNSWKIQSRKGGIFLVKDDVAYRENYPQSEFRRSSPKGYVWVESAKIAHVQWDVMAEMAMDKEIPILGGTFFIDENRVWRGNSNVDLYQKFISKIDKEMFVTCIRCEFDENKRTN